MALDLKPGIHDEGVEPQEKLVAGQGVFAAGEVFAAHRTPRVKGVLIADNLVHQAHPQFRPRGLPMASQLTKNEQNLTTPRTSKQKNAKTPTAKNP